MVTMSSAPPDHTTPARALQLTAVLLIAGLPVLAGSDLVGTLGGVRPPPDGIGAYTAFYQDLPRALATALVAVSAVCLTAAPGLLTVLLTGAARSTALWLSYGTGAALVVTSLLVIVIEQGLGIALRGAGFASMLLAATAVLGVAAALLSRRRTLGWPVDASTTSIVVTGLGACIFGVVALGPKFFWENFNGDGAHAHEAARLLLIRPVPFFGQGAGDIASFPDMRSWLFAYPASWFLRLFGEGEASSRLAVVPHLLSVAAGIAAVAEYRRPLVDTGVMIGVWLALATFVVALGFSGTYSAYHADFGLPLTQDAQLVGYFLMMVVAWWLRQHAWMFLGVLLTVAALPNGAILVVLLIVATTLFWRGSGRPSIVGLSLALVGAVVVLEVVARALPAMGLPPPGSEYGGAAILRRYRFITLIAWERLGWAIVPAGILPAVAMLRWRALDEPARALTATSVVYFSAVYFQGSAVLHHFVPAMLIPISVLWRSPLRVGLTAGPAGWSAMAMTTGIAAALCWPAHFALHVQSRAIGEAIEWNVPGYALAAPESFRAAELLEAIVPVDYAAEVPAQTFGTSPLVLAYYARQRRSGSSVSFVLHPAKEPPPAGFPALLGANPEFALHARSASTPDRYRALSPPSPAGRPWLGRPRNELFGRMGEAPRWRYLDLLAVARSLGLDHLIPGAELAQ